MSFPIESLPDIPASLIDDVKNFVRVDHAEDDQAIEQFLRSAATLCEEFVGQMLIARTVTDMLPAKNLWQKLKQLPVQTISHVEAVAADGSNFALSADGYAMDIDSDGLGWIKASEVSGQSRIRVTYEAGVASNWTDLPASLEQGIVRLAGYFYTNRDGVDQGGPPSAVTALWRPHRRLRLA